MNKKILSMILIVAMVLSLASTAFADSATHNCDSSNGVYCIVCDVAEKINLLPAAGEITVNNAADVTNQIHAIDRLKGELTDEQYEQLLTLVETGNDGSGYGSDVPVRYMDVVKAIQQLGGNSLAISKKFVSTDGEPVNVENAEVQFSITNVDTNASQIVTMSTMYNTLGTLSGDANFYSMNAEGDGWTFTYILPAGTYRIKEVSDFGATVNGVPCETTEVTYNGSANADGILVTLAAGATDNVNFTATNSVSPIYSVDAKDAEGNPVSGVGMRIQGITEPEFSHNWITDGSETRLTLRNGRTYTLNVTSVPAGYQMPSPATVTFTVNGDTSAFEGAFKAEGSRNQYTVTVTIPSIKIDAEFKTMADAGYYAQAEDAEDKTGVVALNAAITNIDDISGNIVKYGMSLYKGGFADATIDDAESNLSNLLADGGYYHSIIKNIAEEDFDTVFYGIPFVVVDLDGDLETQDDWTVCAGSVVSASVSEYYKWLGTVSAY